MDERAGGMAGPGMHDQAGGLVDDGQIVVLVHDPQVHWLGFQPARRRRRELPAQAIARAQPAPGPGRAIIEADEALGDQALHPAAALPDEQPGQVLVESRGIGGDGVLYRLAQARRDRPPRQTVPRSRIATPTVIAESATLKMGQ